MKSDSPYIFNIPEDQRNVPVKLWNQKIFIPTYEVGEADKNPMFFEKRVYQGSCGKVYPLPYYDKVSDEKADKEYDGVFLENKYVRFLILPELGGRIQVAQDKTNKNYDFFYRNDVIKPALVGLSGPWLSGGVEFNWPLHHRPATYMAVEYIFEEDEDGIKTVWLSDHDPMERMKGMIGLSLKPDSSILEAKVRLYNRTDETKTFLWWANVAAEVHDQYQSFFPPDVNYVADHAARAMTEFPLSKSEYYGIDYAPGTDISRYRNIPVPTSYMVVETEGEFFGGYDFNREGGFVHVANKHISPGKKQWTWGNSLFGWAWDRNLTDENGPYVELMAGVYTNNQPDFTYLMPGETKSFSQIWYPIQGIGIAHEANLNGAVHLSVKNGTIRTGICVTSPVKDGKIVISGKGEILISIRSDLVPGTPFLREIPCDSDPIDLSVELISNNGIVLISYVFLNQKPIKILPDAAKETPSPWELKSTEELYIAGEHLRQYRLPNRYPEDYWKEALKRDPGDIRCNTALGQFYLGRFEYSIAEFHFRKAIERLTSKHPNPVDGEAFYGLGQALKHQDRFNEAYRAFYKSTWNFAWKAAGYFEVALLDIKNGEFRKALEHLDISIRHNSDNFKALALQAAVLRTIGCYKEALEITGKIMEKDKLYFLGRNERILILREMGNFDKAEDELRLFNKLIRDSEINYLDTVFDYMTAGLYTEGEDLLERLISYSNEKCSPFPYYCMARTKKMKNIPCKQWLDKAAAHAPDYFFPSTSYEHDILVWAVEESQDDSNAPYYLGNLLYDKKRKEEAVRFWETAKERGTVLSTVYRNLGIACFNFKKNLNNALVYYKKAFSLAPEDGRVLFELDQLKKKMNISLEERKAFIYRHYHHVNNRDDLAIEMANLYILTGEFEKALKLLSERRFHPWEGGEGQVLRVWSSAHLSLGKKALENGEYSRATDHFKAALNIPETLGETWHPLQNQSPVYYYLGLALQAAGENGRADDYFRMSSESKSDFSAMAVQEISENTYFAARSMFQRGRIDEAQKLFRQMINYGERKLKEDAFIDYFATSLPLLLVFEDDTKLRNDLQAKYIIGLGYAGLNNKEKFDAIRNEILNADISHPVQLF